jgi:hypothetical protein
MMTQKVKSNTKQMSISEELTTFELAAQLKKSTPYIWVQAKKRGIKPRHAFRPSQQGGRGVKVALWRKKDWII